MRFDARKPIIGMIHLLPLPGSPDSDGDERAVLARAIEDAEALEAGGVDGVLIQNRRDGVFPGERAGAETIVAMTHIASAVRERIGVELGIHVLRNDVIGSLAIASACGGSFVRAAALTGAAWTAQGILQPDTMRILHERRRIGAEQVAILADVWSMHYRPVAAVPAGSLATDALAAGATGVVVAEPAADNAAALIDEVRAAIGSAPILIGGYATADNIGRLLARADGAIVGGAFEDPDRDGRVDVDRVRLFMAAARGSRVAPAGEA